MADVELLPLHIAPSVEPVDYPDVAQALMDYARANLAPLQAENERLRSEVKRVTCELMDATTRAERLAEALWRYGVHDQECVEENIPICTCGLDAALAQEDRND